MAMALDLFAGVALDIAFVDLVRAVQKAEAQIGGNGRHLKITRTCDKGHLRTKQTTR